jgi:hypothetical protein
MKIVRKYKVVTFGNYLDAKLGSAYARDRAFSVHYGTTFFAKAPGWLAERGYHLTVFDTLDNALYFRDDLESRQVWVCECRGRQPLPDFRLSSCIAKHKYSLQDFVDGWPKGTEMYKEVVLVYRLH